MGAPTIGSLDQIALRPIKVGARNYVGGDRFDVERHRSHNDLDNRQLEVLRRQGFYGPLTREAYQICMQRREPGAIGQGFEPAYLIELGIIDEPPAAKAPKAAKPGVDPSAAPQLGEPIPYKGRLIVPVKVGNFTKFEVKTVAGELLRAQRFGKTSTAQAFIDELPPVESTESPASDTDAAKKENSGDGHLQQQSGGFGQQG